MLKTYRNYFPASTVSERTGLGAASTVRRNFRIRARTRQRLASWLPLALVLFTFSFLSIGCSLGVSDSLPAWHFRFVDGETGKPMAGVAVLMTREVCWWHPSGLGSAPVDAWGWVSDDHGDVRVPFRKLRANYEFYKSPCYETIQAFKAGGWHSYGDGRRLDRAWRPNRPYGIYIHGDLPPLETAADGALLIPMWFERDGNKRHDGLEPLVKESVQANFPDAWELLKREIFRERAMRRY